MTCHQRLTYKGKQAMTTKTFDSTVSHSSQLFENTGTSNNRVSSALNRVRFENGRLKVDRFTKEDVYIIMNTLCVAFLVKDVKNVIRESMNTISEFLGEPSPKIKTGERVDANGKTRDVVGFVYTRKTVKVFLEYVENNPLGWQALNRKFILGEWLHHGMTIPA